MGLEQFRNKRSDSHQTDVGKNLEAAFNFRLRRVQLFWYSFSTMTEWCPSVIISELVIVLWVSGMSLQLFVAPSRGVGNLVSMSSSKPTYCSIWIIRAGSAWVSRYARQRRRFAQGRRISINERASAFPQELVLLGVRQCGSHDSFSHVLFSGQVSCGLFSSQILFDFSKSFSWRG